MKATSLGPIVKAKETLKVFATSAPSPRELLSNRAQRFDRLHTVLPSNASRGEPLTVTVQAWDQCERLHGSYEGTFELDSTDPRAAHPAAITFDRVDGGLVRIDGVAFGSTGTHYLMLTHDGTGETYLSNPVRVATDHDRRVYWGDLHLHSFFSDGAGDAERGYEFGRDVMALDVAAYTDHDTMGFFIPPQWQRARMHRRYFDRLCELAEAFTDDGEFVALPGFEWTKQPNMGGHLNVYFEDGADATLFDSLDPETCSYEALWDRLRQWDRDHDSGVVTIPHHPAESMYPFDFAAVDYDDELAPLVEVYSQWGSSERPGSEGNRFPLRMGQGEIEVAGHYVRDAHRLGYRVGLVGGSDYHGPHPGHSLIHARPHLPSLDESRRNGIGWANVWRVWDERSYPGGLTAFLTPELTRHSIFEALRSRSVYASTQPHRILVNFRVNGVDVATQDDAVVVESPEAIREVAVDVAGTAPIERVTVVKNNAAWRTFRGTADPSAGPETFTIATEWTDDDPLSGMAWDEKRGTDGDVYAVRVIQASDDRHPGTAWVGPLWLESR